jgi:hypothetical protein
MLNAHHLAALHLQKCLRSIAAQMSCPGQNLCNPRVAPLHFAAFQVTNQARKRDRTARQSLHGRSISGDRISMISQLSGPGRPSPLEQELTLSLTAIAEDLDCALRYKQEIERRLSEVIRERDSLNARCEQAKAELANIRTRMKMEITNLQLQLAESSKSTLKRQQAELAAREKLIRDEFERKLQTIQVGMKQERHQLQQRLAKMKEEMSACICRQTMELAERR